MPRGLRVLVADDDRGWAAGLVPPLTAAGYTVRVTPAGPRTREAARAEHPDVVILGAGGPDGYDLAGAIHRQAAWRKPMLVGLADRADDAAERRAAAAGVHLLLPEPVDLGVLLAFLRRFEGLLADVEGFDPAI
jgi:DNA-binding response OmpR family regulator